MPDKYLETPGDWDAEKQLASESLDRMLTQAGNDFELDSRAVVRNIMRDIENGHALRSVTIFARVFAVALERIKQQQ